MMNESIENIEQKRNKMKTSEDRITLRADKELKNKLAKAVKSTGQSPSQLVRLCIERGLPIVTKHMEAMNNDFQSLSSSSDHQTKKEGLTGDGKPLTAPE